MINNILNKYINNEKNVNITNYTLESITTLLGHFSNPHKNFKSLHIAGTNGKGSTAFMLSAALQKAGYKTGLYTSPHLVSVNERIKVNSINIDDDLLYQYINSIDEIVSRNNLQTTTFFDLLTTAAFLYFSDQSVDIAVIETGLGGRLDSTNVIVPEVSIITDISKDHMAILGNNIEDIAAEKCGIVKRGIPVVTTNDNQAVIHVIKDYSKSNNSELFIFSSDFTADKISRNGDFFIFDYKSSFAELSGIKLSLFPEHQIKNASAVITVLLLLKSKGFTNIDLKIISSVLEEIHVPGRFQILNHDPVVVYDPAHNFQALKNLIQGLDNFYSDKKKTYIVAMMKDKADRETLDLFNDLETVYYQLDDARAYVPVGKLFKAVVCDEASVMDLISHSINPDKMFIFTGTFRIYNSAVSIVNKLFNNEFKIQVIDDNKR